MEVRPGYKRTEIGVLPEDWDVIELEEAARVVDSLHQTPSFAGDGYPMVRVTDIKTGNLRFTEALMVSEAVFAEFTRNYKPKRGDIVLSRVGSYGISSFVETDEPFCMGQNTVVLQPKLPARFLYYVLNSSRIRKQIEDGSYGSGYKSLSLKNIKELRIPVPQTDHEQRAIAAALSDVDALLAKLDQFIDKKRDLKRAAMQQLLTGQTRLPGFEGDWEVKALRNYVRDFIVPMRDKPRKLTGHIPWCRIEDFEGRYLYESKSEQFVDDQTVREMNLKVFPTGALLVSCSADLGRCAIVGRPLVSNQTFIGLVFDEAIASNEFFYYYMTSRAAELNNLSSGTTISYLSREQFETFVVSIPADKKEQTTIATVLSDMDAEIAALEARRDKTRALKQGMMQELLTGRIRLV